jgi:hypothetical protein
VTYTTWWGIRTSPSEQIKLIIDINKNRGRKQTEACLQLTIFSFKMYTLVGFGRFTIGFDVDLRQVEVW